MAKDSKRKNLTNSGTMNPNADAVADELFKKGEFFDRFDLLQVKYEMLRRVEKDRHAVVQAASEFGFSRRHFYDIQKQFAKGGMQGLMPEKRGPKGAHKLNDSVMDFIAAALQKSPETKAPKLAILIENQFGIKIHPRSIERALERKKKGDE